MPAIIPDTDLTIAWVNSLHGSGSATMVYDGFGLWSADCTGALLEESYTLACTNGVATWNWIRYNTAGDCPDGSVVANCNVPWDTYTSSPFKLEFTSFHGWCTNIAETMGYSRWTITTAATGTSNCCVTILVTGCNGLALSGSSVTISSSGSTVGTGQTSAVNIILGETGIEIGTAGTYDITVTNSPRFSSATFSGTVLACRTTTTLDMSSHVASGYKCFVGCVLPVSNTLHATFSVAGIQTLTWSSTAWVGSFTASGHAYVVTINPDGTMTITRDGASCGVVTLTITACPPSFAGNFNIPAGNCATELGSANASLTE